MRQAWELNPDIQSTHLSYEQEANRARRAEASPPPPQKKSEPVGDIHIQTFVTGNT